MAELIEKKKIRTVIKSKATRFENFINNYVPVTETFFELESRLEKFEQLWSEFEKIQGEIDAFSTEIDNREWEQFENGFFSTLSMAKRKKAQCMELSRPASVNSESAILSNGSSVGVSHARLPIITLPNFDGSYERWQSFFDTFNAMVHRNTTLDTITKFHYLQSALIGKAKEYINAFEITENNYDIAIDLLKKRYHNSRLIIQHHIQQLFNLPQVNKDIAGSLRALSDGLQKHTRILKQLKEPVDTWDTLLIYLASTKLDIITKREWELKVVSSKLSKLTEFLEFLDTRCQMMEAISSKAPHTEMTKTGFNQGTKREGNKILTHVATGKNSVDCVLCHKDHRVYTCSAFQDLSVENRRDKVKELNLCFNCLGIKHAARDCRSTRLCKHCNHKHHSLLHFDNQGNFQSNSNHQLRENERQSGVNSESGVSVNLFAHKDTSEKILSTVAIYIQNDTGQKIKVRALLDNGSMANFMTENLCNKLNLKKNNVNHTVSGIDLTQTNINFCTSATIKSTLNAYKLRTDFFVTNNISQCIPTKKIDLTKLSIPDHIHLADPDFYKPQPVDILLGTSIFWDCLEPKRILQGQGHPVLQLTKFGWILGGQLSTERKTKQSDLFCGFLSESSLNQQLQRFWTINEGDSTKIMSAEEKECEAIFTNTCKRASDGKFEVTMPMKSNLEELGESRASAEKRLLMMERRFKKDAQLKERYSDVMKDYVDQGHMSKVTMLKGSFNYLPHHAVQKEASTTTKTRVVFDGSNESSSGLSLNDCMLTGPIVQQELFNIIIRFRIHRFVITGDIVQMYRQIWVEPSQRRLQCILWRESPDQPMDTYQLNTVTFGITASPYLATRCLLKLADDNQDLYPNASRVIKDDFYVDDMLTGADTEEEIVDIKNDVNKILSSAGFKLQKVHSNADLPQHDQEDHEITEIKTLGLRWQPREDLLKYDSSYKAKPGFITKRMMLSSIAQIFDPLGLIGPFILRSKILLQHLWKLKLSWDDPIPGDVAEKWIFHCNQLQNIKDLNIPRYVLVASPRKIQIHGFSDASESAYGACIYMRTEGLDGVVVTHLLCARSRVAPMKSVSLPRLELCGALLLAEVYAKIRDALTISIEDVYFWSDSTIALSWIKGDPSRWHTFVSNRVAEIQRLTPLEKWDHVRTDENPADLISRGADLNQLMDARIWWNGPEWLQKDEDSWPHDEFVIPEVPEEKKLTLTFAVQERDFSMLRRCSSWNRLRRVTAYCLRFKENAFKKAKGFVLNKDILSAEELNKADVVLLKMHQEEEFSKEIGELRRNKAIDSNSRILSLNPFLDDVGLLRVGGRLSHASISYSQRFPIILSSNHVTTELIIRDHHYKNLHAGTSLLLANLRERYWILSSRNAIRKVLRKCVLCFRIKPKNEIQLMGNLPVERVTPSRAFAHTGIDYAGPFNIKISRNKTQKAYLCVFVCLAVKAVHLELVSDLSTNAFLNALKRFIARRGKCLSLSSDNGKNFIGANNELQKIVANLLTETESRSKILNFVADNSIKWNFIPPYSPHMGGLWEAAVKSAKSHLRAVINGAPFTFEEFYTIIVEIEAILNSRPMCPVSSDPNDMNVLTPGHFLIGTSLSSILEESVLDIPTNRVNRFQLLSQVQQSFWRRWSTEYITQMQSRSKWKRRIDNSRLHLGRMVLLKDDNLPPLRWRLGRIEDLHPGTDGLVRVVSVRTSAGIVKRSLPKICILPIDE
ncbi:uncharacterized protein LOC122498348 [Leptopilina heterotoma]|uniref:uncharacterized protein LOC122498348 n=1 Tax=Leptopilina heterotoma TaxID=63436 RepID=UPI001CA948AA|nr:uncharacterized protein LOC122498348 [Leptopilina heterotoma]